MIKRRPRKKKVYVYVVLVALLATVFFLGKGVWGVYEKNRAAKERRDELALEFETLKARKTELEVLTSSLKTDRGLEAELRAKFEVARPGEHTAIIVSSGNDATTTESNTGGWWKKIKDLF